MSAEATDQTIRGYLDALVARGRYAHYFADNVVCSLMGEGLDVTGRDAVEQFITGFHTQSFDARPELKSLVCGDDQAALEAVFVGTHTGDFMGIPATGKEVNVPYSVHYDLEANAITALRIYMPMDVLMRQLDLTAPVEQTAQ